jgi:hypothetical protein
MSRPAPIIAAVLLLLPVLYVGSYLALVVPERGGRLRGGSGLFYRHPYRAGGARSSAAFWPLEQIDRRLRPGVWEPPMLNLGLKPQGSTLLVPPPRDLTSP